MKFKIGQKVRVNLKERENRFLSKSTGYRVLISRDMREMDGKITTIVDVRKIGLGYVYYIEGSIYRFTEEMLVNEENEKNKILSRKENAGLFFNLNFMANHILPRKINIEKIITNNKVVIVLYNYNGKIKKVKAVCDKDDAFSLEKGVDICCLKIIRNFADKELRKTLK